MIISTLIISTQNNKKGLLTLLKFFFSFFLFLLQNVEKKIMNERAKLMNTIKKFREKFTLHGDNSTKRELQLLENQLNFTQIWLMTKMRMILVI